MKPSEFLYKEDGRYLLSAQTLRKLDNRFIDRKRVEDANSDAFKDIRIFLSNLPDEYCDELDRIEEELKKELKLK